MADPRFPEGQSIQQWASDLLSALGMPVTSTNVGILTSWANAESGGYNPNASGGRNNPLNTTQQGPGWIGGGGSQGNISDFDTYAHGVAAQAANLKNPRFGYPAILQGLKNQNPAQVFAAINASSFGTHFPSGYTGGGAQAPTATSGITAAGGTADATLTAATDDCLWKITMPGPIPNFCFHEGWGRAMLGAVSLVGGALLVIGGLIVIAGNSKAGRAALQVVPIAAAVA